MQTDSPARPAICAARAHVRAHIHSTSACNSSPVQSSVGPPDDCGRRRAGGGRGGSLRHAAHFPLCGFVASGTGRPRGARTRGRRANGMTMPALATRASTLLFLSCGHKLVCVAIAKHSRGWRMGKHLNSYSLPCSCTYSMGTHQVTLFCGRRRP